MMSRTAQKHRFWAAGQMHNAFSSLRYPNTKQRLDVDQIKAAISFLQERHGSTIEQIQRSLASNITGLLPSKKDVKTVVARALREGFLTTVDNDSPDADSKVDNVTKAERKGQSDTRLHRKRGGSKGGGCGKPKPKKPKCQKKKPKPKKNKCKKKAKKRPKKIKKKKCSRKTKCRRGRKVNCRCGSFKT